MMTAFNLFGLGVVWVGTLTVVMCVTWKPGSSIACATLNTGLAALLIWVI